MEYLIIYTYVHRFHLCTKWLRLNDIEYYLRENAWYKDGLDIVILKPKEKYKIRWINEIFLRKIFPMIQKMEV